MPIQVLNRGRFNLSVITHGRQITASNTGIAGAGLTSDDLESAAGPLITSDNTTLEGYRFTSNVKIAADGCTIRNCLFDFAGEADLRCLIIEGTGNTVEYCTMVPTGPAAYEGIYMQDGLAFDTTLTRLHIENVAHLITDECGGNGLDGGYGLILAESYLVGPAADQVGQHLDCIQCYGGGSSYSKLYDRCWIEAIQGGVYCVNVTPFGSNSVGGLDVFDCYMDQGNSHILAADNQTSGVVHNLRVKRCGMGGWTNNSDYNPLQLDGSITVVETDAEQASEPTSIVWPTTGDDANLWEVQAGNPGGLSPDRTGAAADPAVFP